MRALVFGFGITFFSSNFILGSFPLSKVFGITAGKSATMIKPSHINIPAAQLQVNNREINVQI